MKPILHRQPHYRTVLSALLLIGLLLPWHAQAQIFPRGNGMVLTGIQQLDLYVDTSRLLEQPTDPVAFRLGTQRLLEGQLASAGISRRSADRNYLVCSIEATRSGTQLAYSTNIELWSRQSTDVHSLLWRNGRIATTGIERFSPELIAGECAEQFLSEWGRWNRVRSED